MASKNRTSAASQQDQAGRDVCDNEEIQEERRFAPETDSQKPPVASLREVAFEDHDVPKPDGDMYERLLAPLLERDKVQCAAWKDEVQNLLIFAGLFSAVVTAFVLESHKGLQPAPHDDVVSLLLRIADRLDAPSNASTAISLSPQSVIGPFEPTRSSVRVNIFWFISLVLSLTTVLVGIVSLQWLREHQRYDSFYSSELKFAIFNLRSESLARWYVPQLFAAMPIALQAALMLFFVGIIDFLLALHHEVAVCVVPVIALAFLFFLVTTLLPVLQAYTLVFPILLQVNSKVPVPMPFKSPQSHLLHQLSASSKSLFFVSAYLFAPFYALIIVIPSHVFNAMKEIVIYRRKPNIFNWAPSLQMSPRYHWHLLKLDSLSFSTFWTSSRTWIESDAQWPKLRTEYFVRKYQHDFIDFDRTWDVPNLYDCAYGFRAILKETQERDQIRAVYHCGQQFLATSLRNAPGSDTQVRSRTRTFEALFQLAGNLNPGKAGFNFWLEKAGHKDVDILRTIHERALLFFILNLCPRESIPRELHFAWAKSQLSHTQAFIGNNPAAKSVASAEWSMFLESFHQVTYFADLSKHWTALLKEILENILTRHPDFLEVHGVLIDRPILITVRKLMVREYNDWICVLLTLQSSEDALSTMDVISDRLQGDEFHFRSPHHSATAQRPYFVAYIGCEYLQEWLYRQGNPQDSTPPHHAVRLHDTIRVFIDSIHQTSSGDISSNEEDHKIHERLAAQFLFMKRTFDKKYPASVAYSMEKLSSATMGAWRRLCHERVYGYWSTTESSLLEDCQEDQGTVHSNNSSIA